MKAVRHAATDPALQDVFDLIVDCFAYMDGRIDSPSSIHTMTRADLATKCTEGEVWSIGTPPCACVGLTVRGECLYVGKLAVAKAFRSKGLAAKLIDIATERARAQGLGWLELQTRVELVENHQAFARLGFVKVGESAHEGFDRATSITMRRAV